MRVDVVVRVDTVQQVEEGGGEALHMEEGAMGMAWQTFC